MPGTKEPSFSLTSTFMPVGDRNVLTGFLAVNGDPGNQTGKRSADYGTLRLLETTGGNVKGPGQVFNDMRTSGVASKDPQLQLTLAQFITTTQSQGAATVTFGNQLTLPVGGGLLYVQPIYVQAKAGGSYPRLSAVAVAFGEKIAWAGSLDDALNDLFGGSSGAQAGDTGTDTPGTPTPGVTGTPGTPTPGVPTTPPPTPAPGATTPAPTGTPNPAALAQALKDAEAAYAQGETALKSGDFARLASRTGETTLRVLVTDRVAPGVVYTTFHHPTTQANVVTTDFSDWATNCPEYKVTAVQVTPSNGATEWQRDYAERTARSRRIADSEMEPAE